MFKNSAEFEEEDVLNLMFADGFGPNEAMDHAEAYAREITGRASVTAVEKVQRIIRRIERNAQPC